MFRESFRRRCLPHWDVAGAPVFVTSCLQGSVPARGQLDIAAYRAALENGPIPAGLSTPEWNLRRRKLVFARMDEWLDQRPAVRHLADARLAQPVVDAMFHFAGERYDLLAYVVMPSHIHWVFLPLEHWVHSLGDAAIKRTPRERIVHSVNRQSGFDCNKLLGTSGSFWQHESYDHWVRDVAELERIILYVEGNAVKAGLAASPAEFQLSSAHVRHELGLELGQPLPRRQHGGAGLESAR
jgi:type I restriction enzyme R subunit